LLFSLQQNCELNSFKVTFISKHRVGLYQYMAILVHRWAFGIHPLYGMCTVIHVGKIASMLQQ